MDPWLGVPASNFRPTQRLTPYGHLQRLVGAKQWLNPQAQKQPDPSVSGGNGRNGPWALPISLGSQGLRLNMSASSTFSLGRNKGSNMADSVAELLTRLGVKLFHGVGSSAASIID
jgi:hypothetical protein